MNRVQERASVHEKTVQDVARGEVWVPRKRAPQRQLSTRVRSGERHPALVMAHALGIKPERVEITAPPPMWGCVIHNDGSWRS